MKSKNILRRVIFLAFFIGISSPGRAAGLGEYFLEFMDAFYLGSPCRLVASQVNTLIRAGDLRSCINEGQCQRLGPVGNLRGFEHAMYGRGLMQFAFQPGDQLVAVKGMVVRERPPGGTLFIVPDDLAHLLTSRFALDWTKVRSTWLAAYFFPAYPEYRELEPLLTGRYANWSAPPFSLAGRVTGVLQFTVDLQRYLHLELLFEGDQTRVTLKPRRCDQNDPSCRSDLPDFLAKKIGARDLDPRLAQFYSTTPRPTLSFSSRAEAASFIRLVHRDLTASF